MPGWWPARSTLTTAGGVLELSGRGHELVESLMAHRRAVLADLVSRMPEPAQRQLVEAVAALLESVEAGPDHDLFAEPRDASLRWLR